MLWNKGFFHRKISDAYIKKKGRYYEIFGIEMQRSHRLQGWKAFGLCRGSGILPQGWMHFGTICGRMPWMFSKAADKENSI